ncbi:MAG: molecular chaperone HtpG [Bacilli bacterium]|nr:molecular chaperone HtpG [Bacilli bacterium]
MKKQEFKAESKRLLDLMINSIYTNKDIFLRELISNASDAIDKLYYESLVDSKVEIDRDDFSIKLLLDKEKKTITISDNGIGMSKDELDHNLGTICESGSLLFKKEKENREEIDVIGQFGVGFYSAFMIAAKIEVISKKYGSNEAYKWSSDGVDGYTIEKSEKDTFGTDIIIYLKDDSDDYEYSRYLDEYVIDGIVKKYSNYITYPIKMNKTSHELKEGSKDEYIDVEKEEVLNSMMPIWKKNPSEVTEEEYSNFYTDTYYDYEKPQRVFRNSVEGKCTYTSLLFIPSHTPYDFYGKDYEKGLSLYSNGVLVMDKCPKLLPDHFSFVKGLVDSPDVSLNISREILQEDKEITLISKSIEGKIKKELEDMLKNDREKYLKFFENFGLQLKVGVYNDYGMYKDDLKDLLLFYSSEKKSMITLAEYVENLKDGQDKIYYASGETYDKIDLLPQVENFKEKNLEVLYLKDYIDEFALQMLREYDGKAFVNISKEDVNLDSEEDKKALEEENKKSASLFELMKETLASEVSDVKFTNRLKNHPVCLTSKGNLSIEMEKVINAMPTDEHIHAEMTLEVNKDHPIAQKLKDLYETDKEELKKYTKILYSEARLIEGLPIENPTEISNLICEMLSK